MPAVLALRMTSGLVLPCWLHWECSARGCCGGSDRGTELHDVFKHKDYEIEERGGQGMKRSW